MFSCRKSSDSLGFASKWIFNWKKRKLRVAHGNVTFWHSNWLPRKERKVFSQGEGKKARPGRHFFYFMISTFFRKLALGVLELMLLRTRNRARLKLWGKKVEQENPQHCCLCPINYNYVLNISSTFLVEGICSKLGLTRSDSTQIGFFFGLVARKFSHHHGSELE